MGQAFASFFAMFASFFRAGESVGRIAENFGTWGERASATFVVEADLNRDLAVQKADQARAKLKAEIEAERIAALAPAAEAVKSA